MPKRSSSELLNDAVEAMMATRDVPVSTKDQRLAELLQIAADLRDLPSPAFKAGLKASLQKTGETPATRVTSVQPRPTAAPCLVVSDPPRAIEFYKRAFGASEVMRFADPSGNVVHAQIQIGDSPIDIAPEEKVWGNFSPQTLGGSPVIVRLYVDDVDALASRAVAEGARVIFPVADQFYGDRAGRLADPFGHIWIVATHKEDVTVEEMERRTAAWTSEAATETAEPTPQSSCVVEPHLAVAGAAKLIDFLTAAFGAAETSRHLQPDGSIAHAQMRIGDSTIGIGDVPPDSAKPTALHLYVPNADALYEKALHAGARSTHAPVDQPYGDHEASVEDPFGNHWYIATHLSGHYVPEGLHTINSYLHPHGAPRLIEFMKRALGAEELFRAQAPDGSVAHAKIRIGESVVEMGEAHGPYQPMPTMYHLYVADTDAAYQRAVAAGARSLGEPTDQPWGYRNAGIEDPGGNQWWINSPTKASTHAAESSVQRRGVMPFLYISDPTAAFDFYRRVLGATELMREVEPSGAVSHVQIRAGDTLIMLRDSSVGMPAEFIEKGLSRTARDLGGTPVHLYLYVDDVDAVYKRALQAGATVVDKLGDKEWGDRCGGFQDPFGHIWYIATPLKSGS